MPVTRLWARCFNVGYVICAIMAPSRYECHATLTHQHALAKVNTMDGLSVELVSISTSSPDKQRLLVHGGPTPVSVCDPNMSRLSFGAGTKGTAGFKVYDIIKVRRQLTVWTDNHTPACHDIVSSGPASVLPCDTQQHPARLRSHDDRGHENLRPRQFLLNCGLESHDPVLIGTDGGKLIGGFFKSQRKDGDGDSGKGGKHSVMVVDETGDPDYERHVTSAWILFGGLFLLLIYVVWDWLQSPYNRRRRDPDRPASKQGDRERTDL